MTEYTACLIPENATVRDALARICSLSGLPLTLFITSTTGRLLGTLTDGDIRRGLLAGATLQTPAAEVMNTGFRALHSGADNLDAFSAARALGLELLPVLDAEGRIEQILDLRHVTSQLPVDAVVMAGGRGERLRPLTLTTPKPLLPVGDVPIIDRNIHALLSAGISSIFVTVNYLHEQIEAHLAPQPAHATVTCVRETQPLGTFGSIGLIKQCPPGLTKPDTLVMNADLLTTLSFEKMYRHHRDTGSALTMAVIPYTVAVPYAILQTEGERILSFEEKPTYTYYANAGIYMVQTPLLQRITGRERVDATDFTAALIAEGRKVTYFPIDGTWIDIGSPQDYRLANEKFK